MAATRPVSDVEAVTNATEQPPLHVADAAFANDIRIVVLYVTIIVGVTGGMLVFCWLWYNRRRKSRVNAVILHVALSDMFVMVGACVSQLAMEISGRHWILGNACCKIVKCMQVFAIFSSNYMLVVLSVDRHQAIRAPLREPFAVWKMTLLGWLGSFILSTPQLIIFRVNFVTDPRSQFYNISVCESFFRVRPAYYRQAYIMYADIFSFIVPLIVVCVCYIRIFLKIREKAMESTSCKKVQLKPGKVHLQSTPSSSLPKAKIKTLKMTVVIVLTFILCGMPYHILELIYSFGDHSKVSPVLAAILGGMAPVNSATNPYVFLLFNANTKCMRGVLASILPRRLLNIRGGDYETALRSDYSTMHTDMNSTRVAKGNADYSTTVVADHCGGRKNMGHMPDVLEMSVKEKSARKTPATYPLIEEAECAFEDEDENEPKQ